MSLELVCRPLEGHAEYRACFELQLVIWGRDFVETVAPALLWVAQRTGGIASGAFTPAGELVGFIFGITGYRDGAPVHWSDMLGVHPRFRGVGAARALKLHQRDRLLAGGVRHVQWTFDPLESRNAHLNFVRLGGTAHEYVRDAYGESDSPLHQGIGTDRLIVSWALDSERVQRRVAGNAESARGGERVNDVAVAAWPRCTGTALDLAAPRLRLRIPADIQALKQARPELAREWRECTRAAFEHYFARGYGVVDFVRESEALGCYVLERPGAP